MEHLETFLAPFQFLVDPGKRIYWLYLLTALLAASVVVSFHQGGFNPKKQLKALFNTRYWLHQSSLLDVVLLFVNSLVRITLLIPFFDSRLVATILVGSFLQTHVGDSPSIEIPMVVIAVLFTMSFFVLEDLSRFTLHFFMHREG